MACCGQNTFGSALAPFSPGTGATTAIAELDGSATKKIQLLRIAIAGTALTAIEIDNVRLVKQSTISTGGVAVAGTVVPFASNYGVAPTGTFKAFTTAPTQGTIIGAIAISKLDTDVITTLMPPPGPGIVWDFSNLPANGRPTLLSAAESLAIDLNGATPAHADSLTIYAWWTEGPLAS